MLTIIILSLSLIVYRIGLIIMHAFYDYCCLILFTFVFFLFIIISRFKFLCIWFEVLDVIIYSGKLWRIIFSCQEFLQQLVSILWINDNLRFVLTSFGTISESWLLIFVKFRMLSLWILTILNWRLIVFEQSVQFWLSNELF